MSGDLKERLDVLIRTEQTGSRLLMQLGIDALARIKELERPCASCTSDNPCSFGALARIAELEAQLKAATEALTEIRSWREHTLGERPRKDTRYRNQQADEAFDRGVRMAFYRCADRASAALDPKPTATGETP